MKGTPCRIDGCVRVSHRPDRLCTACARSRGKMRPDRDAQEARDALAELTSQGWTLRAIEDATGITTTALKLIRNGETTKAREDTVRALQVLTTQPLTGVEYVPAWPSQRRIQSLLMAGMSGRHLAQLVGVSPSMISKLTREIGDTMRYDIAAAVDRVWRAHRSNPVTAPNRATRGKPWVAPMWWDNIDNPNEQPGITNCLDCHTGKPTRTGYCQHCNRRHNEWRNAA